MLADFFDGFKDAMLARGFTGPVLLFKQQVARQDSATTGRVVCVLGRDGVSAPTLVGANPRAVAQRNGYLEMHVWGAVAQLPGGLTDFVQSLRNAENLVQTVINAIKDNAVGTSTIDGVDWSKSEETPFMKAGYLAVIPMTVQVPVVDVTYPVSPTGPSGPRLPLDGFVHLIGPSGGMTGP